MNVYPGRKSRVFRTWLRIGIVVTVAGLAVGGFVVIGRWANKAIFEGPESAWLYTPRTPKHLLSTNSAERRRALLAYGQGSNRVLSDIDKEALRHATLRGDFDQAERRMLVAAYQTRADVLVPIAHQLVLEIAGEPSTTAAIKRENIERVLSILKDVDARYGPAFEVIEGEDGDYDRAVKRLPRN